MNNDENHTNQTTTTYMNLINQRKNRLAELCCLRNENQFPFPNNFRPDSYCAELQKKYNNHSKDMLQKLKILVKIAGRIMCNRSSFLVIKDMTGRLQVYINKKTLEKSILNELKFLNLGDIIAVEGTLSRSLKGDLYVNMKNIKLLTKALRPLPEKHHGLKNTEQRYRKRYLDLIVNDKVSKTFKIRSKIISYIRYFFSKRGFIEVETPILHHIPGGATAKPFKTTNNSLGVQMFLRIAPELYLKRLVIGGLEKIFEINRNFRNEGISSKHNPEFTMLEFYQAYATYEDHMDLTELLFRDLSLEILGKTEISYQGKIFDTKTPFMRLSLFESILFFNKDISNDDLLDIKKIKNILKTHNLNIKGCELLGQLQLILFEKLVEPRLEHPTFITHYPIDVSPLARKNNDNPAVTDRFELFIGGTEIANAYSEINDSEDQKQRFLLQLKTNKEASYNYDMYYDEDFINALEYGMPPTAGEGIGIDRLVMLFTDSKSIRDVILFPQMRQQH